MLPSGTDITYFIEVAKLGSVSEAAVKLGLSQPSITISIKRLEQSLQVQLFIRTKKGVQLTNAGKELFLKGQKLLDEWRDIRESTIEKYTSVVGHYRFGCHPSVGLYSLKYFLPELIQKHPELEINLVHDHSQAITQKVIDLQVDIAIAVNPTKHPDLIIKKLFNDEVGLWKSKQNCNENVLICDPELVQSTTIIKKLKRNKLEFSRRIATPSLENIVSLTAAGIGMGIIPGRVVAGSGEASKLVKVTNTPIFQDEICLIYRVENKNIKAIEVMAQTIIKNLA